MNTDAALGCLVAGFIVLVVVWIGFLIWAGFNVVNWLTTQTL